MNTITITYYSVIDNIDKTLSFTQDDGILMTVRECASRIFSDILMPILYKINGIEINEENFFVYIDSANNIYKGMWNEELIVGDTFYDTIDECRETLKIIAPNNCNFSKITIIKEIISSSYGILYPNDTIDNYALKNKFNSILKFLIYQYENYKHDLIQERTTHYKIVISYSIGDELIDDTTHTFRDLNELQDFIFEQAAFLKENVHFGNLNNPSLWYKNKNEENVVIHQIKRIDDHHNTFEILYSDGICTANLKHTSSEVKYWIYKCKDKYINIDSGAINYYKQLFAD